MNHPLIFTVGHSTRSFKEFISLLQSFKIELLADIRSYPGSKRYPHFNKDHLEVSLPENNINYLHIKDLGGRRKPLPNSVNTGWRLDAFRGYADYMETTAFKSAAELLEKEAHKVHTAYMCSEAVWWSCHRSLLSDYFKWKGWRVLHIIKEGQCQEHPYTKPARIVDGKLNYTLPDLFSGSSLEL